VPGPTLTALVSTTQPWPELEQVLDALVPDAAANGNRVEVLVVDGTPGGDAVPAGWYEHLRHEPIGRSDVFECRAAGLRAARGEVVAIVEDHAPPVPGWAAATLAAHERHPDAAVIVGSMVNGTADTVLDRAAYALTLGPFDAPVQPVVRERMPVPANVSFKRWHLAPDAEPGWLEYTAPLAAFERGSLVVAPEAVCLHIQHFEGVRAVTIQFESGRAYGGTLRGISRRAKLCHAATRSRFAVAAYRTSRRGLGPAPGPAEHAALALMIAMNVAGQLVGLVAGPGRSRDSLR
jgi:hypothetical protein